MADTPRVNVAILAMPEVTASSVYAMYDLFAAAGRDWPLIMGGVSGGQLMYLTSLHVTRRPSGRRTAYGSSRTMGSTTARRPLSSAFLISLCCPVSAVPTAWRPKLPGYAHVTIWVRRWLPHARVLCCSRRPAC